MSSKKLVSLILVVALAACMPFTALADDTEVHMDETDREVVRPEVYYAPPEGTIINGVEEKEITPEDVNPMIVDWDHPVFVNYIPDYTSSVTYYKLIAKTSYFNAGPGTAPMELQITRSSSSGSTFNGSVAFTGSVQAGILGKIETEVGFGLELTKSTNEAVGYTYGYDVPPGKTGYIEAYWEGIQSSGRLVVKFPDTGSETGYTNNQYFDIDATVHQSENAINAKCYSK